MLQVIQSLSEHDTMDNQIAFDFLNTAYATHADKSDENDGHMSEQRLCC